MISADTYLHLIGCEILIILGIVVPLLADKTHKRRLSGVFVVVLGLMLAHFASQVLPNRLADFIYSSYREFQPIIKDQR